MAEKSDKDLAFDGMLERITLRGMEADKAKLLSGRGIVIGRPRRRTSNDWFHDKEQSHDEIHSEFPPKGAA